MPIFLLFVNDGVSIDGAFSLLVSLTNHHVASVMIFQEVFFLSQMSINVNQYYVSVGVLNNRNFITTKKCNVTEINSAREMYLRFLAINVLILSFFSSLCLQFTFT